jgi:hypothetical protein
MGVIAKHCLKFLKLCIGILRDWVNCLKFTKQTHVGKNSAFRISHRRQQEIHFFTNRNTFYSNTCFLTFQMDIDRYSGHFICLASHALALPSEQYLVKLQQQNSEPIDTHQGSAYTIGSLRSQISYLNSLCQFFLPSASDNIFCEKLAIIKFIKSLEDKQ